MLVLLPHTTSTIDGNPGAISATSGRPWEVLHTFSGVCEGLNDFQPYAENAVWLFPLLTLFTGGTKAMAGKHPGPLAKLRAEAPDLLTVTVFFLMATGHGKKQNKAGPLKNAL